MPYTNINNLTELVTPNEVRLQCINDANFDINDIGKDLIKLAEITHIEKPLSREFYEELVTQHHNATLTVANTTLLDDYLYRCLCWFVKFEVMNDIQHKTTSSGIVTNIDDFNTEVTPAQYNMMKQDVLRKANIFLQDMLDFLNDSANINNYPTYRDNGGDKSVLGDATTNKSAGIIFY